MSTEKSLTLESWRRSVAALAYQLSQLSSRSNLLGEAGTERGRYFFSDAGVPLPRPCTITAWASLCSLGPSNGTIRHIDGAKILYNPLTQPFLIPFLPKIRHGEDSSQSLARTSRHQVKNSLGDIRWGKIYVANPLTGGIEEEFSHGAISAKLFFEYRNHYFSIAPFRVPPLWAMNGSGWQFGIIQAHPSLNFTLRDPMIELAKNGFPELSAAGDLSPKVNSLLIRFLTIESAKSWANAFSESLKESMSNPAKIEEDFQLLIQDIKTARRHEQDAKDRKSGADSRKGLNMDSETLADFKSLMAELEI